MDNPTLLNNWEFLQPDESILQADWYQQALNSLNGTVGWFYLQDERDNRNYLSLVRKVNFFDTLTSGVLVVNVNMNNLTTILNQETFETMIVDDSNTIVSANRFENIGKKLDEIEFDPRIASERVGSFDEEIDGETYRIMIEPLIPDKSMNELRIITAFSIDHITEDVVLIQRTALIVIAATLLLALILIYAFSGILSNRMLKLSKHITKVATGKLDISLEIDGRDEIAMLARQFNAMVGSINELVEEVRESNQQKQMLESKQNEIKFKMMASQINPHFLFNALESIRMKAHLKGEKEISQVVRLLGKLMRKNLEASRRKTTLEDEFDIVKCYLDIQKFRYEDRLRYELNIDPAAERIPIPPLIIQPLVENAVIHGLENKEEGGTVSVTVSFRHENEIIVEVIDNGAGMPAAKIEELYSSLRDTDDEERNRIGLRNVHLRLQLTYGQSHGLNIESAPGTGTRIYFTIPLGGETHV
jgi:two-component system, sensor histidine kinase YesM